MEIRGDMYPNGLIDCMRNGTIKVIASIRRCGEAHPLLIFLRAILGTRLALTMGILLRLR